MTRKKSKSATDAPQPAPPAHTAVASDASAQDPILPAVNPAIEPHDTPETGSPFHIVCMGASAGGLAPLSQLIRNLPTDTGMAFVVILHMDATHESKLAEILGRETSMPVAQAENHLPVQPNSVYVIPPGKDMVIGERMLQLSPRTEVRGQHRPVDIFMRSLAEEQGYKSIGVILSGTASDGTLGMEEIKAAGGITFAQDATAEQSGMPRSAIAAGCVDLVLPPDEIAREIARIASHPFVTAEGAARPPAADEQLLARLLDLIRASTGVDFTHYKRNTLNRRIARRVVLHKLSGMHDYLQYIQAKPAEVELLYQDILISVTSFFRNPEAYEALKTKVFPRLTEHKSRHDAVRVWALGCSTGEEAYSIAMSYAEYAEATGRRVPMQVFATDLNAAGIERARTGVYPKGIAQDVSPDRLRRFFVENDGGYRIAKPIRDMCVFARQNALGDPPFSRMDLIACRNMLIYLEPVLQQKLMPVLHYSLRNTGFLWLGSSETIGSYRDLFEVEDAKNKIYVKKPDAARPAVNLPLRHGVAELAIQHQQARMRDATAPPDPFREADRVLLTRYAPPGVILNADLDILQFRGDTGAYLTPSPGKASLNILKMLREGLLVGVRGAIHRARREEVMVREEGLRVRSNGGYRDVNVVVIPLRGAGVAGGSVMVLFEEKSQSAEAHARYMVEEAQRSIEENRTESHSGDREIQRLKQELSATREYLQSVIEQQEAANEELQSANEEVQSANEELQSINEELETSKEEIQSSNEELATVNDELQHRNSELSESNNDLLNLLSSVQMAIVMLGADLRIRRFTPAAERLLNLIPADVGRPINDIKLNLSIGSLEPILLNVLDTVTTHEEEVQDKQGKWLSLRVRPYRTLENRIDGAVVMLVDIDSLKRAEQVARESEARFALMADSAPVLIWVFTPEGLQFANRAYYDFLGVEEAQIQKFDWMKFVHPDDREALQAQYLDTLARREPFSAQYRFRRRDGQYRWMKTEGLPRKDENGAFLGYVGSTVDITDLKDAEASLRESDQRKNEFLAMLAHELRNPLASVRNASQLLNAPEIGADKAAHAKSVIERQTRHMVRMVDDLLDVSRITKGHIPLQLGTVDLTASLKHAAEATEHMRQPQGQAFELALPDHPVIVRADAARIDQIFVNLLSNASKFTPRGGRLRLSMEIDAHPTVAKKPAPQAVIRLSDNGIGISADMLPRVFDMFVQGDSDTGLSQPGLGIGLTLVKFLVELHGGTIEVHSPGPGKGAEFVVRLPLASNGQPASGDEKDDEAHSPPRDFLIVDDNVDAAEVLKLLLELEGHSVRTAHSGEKGIELASAMRPDVMLIDIGMPVMSGLEVARKLRAQPRYAHTILIAATGYGLPEDYAASRRAGFDDHLVKPIELDCLLSRIEKLAQPARAP